MHWAQAILFCGGLIYAAVDDLRTRTVSNIVCIVIALAGLITISPASLCVGSWTGTHGILIYVRRAPAGIPCHACIPGTEAECGKEAAAGAIFRSGFYSRVFFIRRKTI